MMPKKEVNFFKRYLKEKGLYNVFKQDLAIALRHNKMPLHKFIESGKKGSSKEIIMDCLLWSLSIYKYWQRLYQDYSIYYLKHYNAYIND